MKGKDIIALGTAIQEANIKTMEANKEIWDKAIRLLEEEGDESAFEDKNQS